VTSMLLRHSREAAFSLVFMIQHLLTSRMKHSYTIVHCNYYGCNMQYSYLAFPCTSFVSKLCRGTRRKHSWLRRLCYKAGRSRVRISIRSMDFSNLPNLSSPTMALGFTQHLTQMTTKNIPVGYSAVDA
jgi:hypothetical protein